jgi:hypothetical protein
MGIVSPDSAKLNQQQQITVGVGATSALLLLDLAALAF